MSADSDRREYLLEMDRVLEALEDLHTAISDGRYSAVSAVAFRLAHVAGRLSRAAWCVHEWDCEERGKPTGERP